MFFKNPNFLIKKRIFFFVFLGFETVCVLIWNIKLEKPERFFRIKVSLHAISAALSSSPRWVTAPWPLPPPTRSSSGGTAPSRPPATPSTSPRASSWSSSSPASSCAAAWLSSCPAWPADSGRSAAAGRGAGKSGSPCRGRTAATEEGRTSAMFEKRRIINHEWSHFYYRDLISIDGNLTSELTKAAINGHFNQYVCV